MLYISMLYWTTNHLCSCLFAKFVKLKLELNVRWFPLDDPTLSTHQNFLHSITKLYEVGQISSLYIHISKNLFLFENFIFSFSRHSFVNTNVHQVGGLGMNDRAGSARLALDMKMTTYVISVFYRFLTSKPEYIPYMYVWIYW